MIKLQKILLNGSNICMVKKFILKIKLVPGSKGPDSHKLNVNLGKN